MVIVPKVAIRGGILSLFISIALVKPNPTPARSVIIMAGIIDIPLTSSFASITDESATTDPIERSIPPVMIIIVIPTVAIPTTDICLNTFDILARDINLGLLIVKKITSPIKKAIVPYL